MGVGVVPVKLFQGLCDPGVQSHLPGSRKLPEQRFLNQGVGELVAVHRLGQFLDDPRGKGLSKNLEQTVFCHLFDQRPQLANANSRPRESPVLVHGQTPCLRLIFPYHGQSATILNQTALGLALKGSAGCA